MGRLRAAWPVLVPVLLAAALHARGFSGFWLGDDLPNLHRAHVWEQAGVLWGDTLRQFLAPITGGGFFIRPMVIASFSLNYELSGARYAGWYAFNFAVHLANVALVAHLVLGLGRRLHREARGAAFVAASFFALNPMVAEGVFWISARSDQWVTLCSLAALAMWLRDERRATDHGVWAYPLLLAVALGFKESAAILPLQMALVALAWPAPRPRGMAFAVAAGAGLLVLYFAFRLYLFGAVFETYFGAGGGRTGLIERAWGGLQTLPSWWAGLTQGRPNRALLYVAASAAGLVVALLGNRGAPLRLALAMLAAAAGMLAATLHSLGGFSSMGEGGRLLYGPVAWMALGLGLLVARTPGERAMAARAASVLVLVATLAGATLLQGTLRHVAHAQQGSRALVRALADLARAPGDVTMVIVPENLGPAVLYRNGQGGLVLPPVQPVPILHRVIPSLPRDIPGRYDEFAHGLATRLTKMEPAQVDAATMRELLKRDEARWPRVMCWLPRERRLLELGPADPARREAWIAQVRAAARACLPDERALRAP